MRFYRLRAVALLAGLLATGVVQAQIRPMPGSSGYEVRSLFGTRTLGFPVYPKPRQSGGATAGVFGPRTNLGRGFSTPPSFSLWEDLPPQPGFSEHTYLQYGPSGKMAVQAAREATLRAPLEQPADSGQAVLEMEGQPQPLPSAAEQAQPGEQAAGEAEAPAAPATQPSAEAAPPGAPSAEAAVPGQGLTGTMQQAAGAARPPAEQAGPLAPAQTSIGPPPAKGVAAGAGGTLAPARQPITSTGRPSYQLSAASVQAAAGGSMLAERLHQALGKRLRSPVQVILQGDTAVLRGAVASEHDRRLAGHLARFEPGIRSVRNELTVAAPASSGSR